MAWLKERDARKDEPIDTIIISDSILRNAETVGLNADVVSVSGAMLGDLTSTTADKCAGMSTGHVDLVIMGGINDVIDKFSNIHDGLFNYHMKTTMNKIKTMLNNVDHKHLYLVEAPIETALHADLQTKLDVCKEYLRELENSRNDVTVIELDTTFPKVDKVHPSEVGTKELLKSLEAQIQKPLIRNPDLITNKYRYEGVERAYKWGCCTCFSNKNRKKADKLHCIDCSHLILQLQHRDLNKELSPATNS